MSDTKLGSLIEINKEAHRDAIHIALAPVTAAENLQPGQHVGLTTTGLATANEAVVKIGIVDPFLDSLVLQGQRFWLLLYQFTVTGMRHHWSHPSFTDTEGQPVGLKDLAKSKLEAWCRQHGFSFTELVEEFTANSYFCVGDKEHLQNEAHEITLLLKDYTGLQNEMRFSCSC